MRGIDLKNKKYYENRELSWLEFNQRVLDEAMNVDNPLFERMKFLSIVSSNLDEFFMVRVASLKAQVNVGYEKEDFSGMTPKQMLKQITSRTHRLVADQAAHYKQVIVPALKEHGIKLLEINEISSEQLDYIKAYFNDEIYPVLTPLAVDSSRPFPLIFNKTLNIGTLIQKGDIELFATVQVPSVLPRYIRLPSDDGSECYILLGSVIKKYINQLFIGYDILCAFPYRITRNADLSIDEEEAQDLLLEIEKSIKMRKWGDVIRLEVQHDMDERLVNYLRTELNIHRRDIFYIDGPLDFTFLMKMYKLKGKDELRYKDFIPSHPKDLLGETDIFEAIRKKDIYLHHPYESFEPVVELIKEAANDEKVLAIKQTLYRVSGQSPIIKALTVAAEGGKQVTVLVELKARFDEENNIQWARRLEKAGCHVIYGLVGLKTHSKVTLIVRKEDEGIRRYVHLGTGNYNDITARLYTDLGLLTCNEKIAADVSAIFNTLSGYSEPPKLNKLSMAPTGLRGKFVDLIDEEITNANEGKVSKIIIKMNALCDAQMIEKLYEASIAGVEVELLIRGICCLIPGIEGISNHITVKSLVGKYLEHSRVFCFYNRGDMKVYLSSADMMPRNLDRRVELLFPIEDTRIKERILADLAIISSDTKKLKIKNSQNIYESANAENVKQMNAHEYFEWQAKQTAEQFEDYQEPEIFVPAMPDQY
ncbi:MAG: RNA degradosome polyphosphate kinase [Vallitaleaceae bacterium]|jgi:polyphosphate kinase|nr:RNA degradosome polyphosphate kinase [Vallitaleaceae bacterium]